MSTDFLRNNSLVKIVAALSAVFLWFFVANDGFKTDNIASPVSVDAINIAPNLAVVNEIEPVNVKVRAPFAAWGALSVDDFSATIDLDGLDVGTHDVQVRVRSESSDVQIVDSTPKVISVELDYIVTEEKNITVRVEGQPGADYASGEPRISVEKAKVSGAKSVVDSLNEVVALVDVSGAMSDVNKVSEVRAFGVNDTRVRVSIEPKTVDVSVPIKRQADIKTVGVRVVTSGSAPSGISITDISVEPSVVTIQGKEDEIKNITYVETEPINLSLIKSSDTLKKRLDLPRGVDLVEGDDTVSIAVSVEDIIKSKTIDITAKTEGLTSGLLARINPPRARLVIEGSEEALNKATDTTITVIIDLSGKQASRFILPVTPDLVTLPDGVSLKEIQTKQFEIIIE